MPLEARVRAARVGLVYELTPRSLLASLGVSILCAIFFYADKPPFATPLWWGALSAITALRYWQVRRFRAVRPGAEQAGAWVRRAAGSAGLAGALWGAWVTVLAPSWGSPGYPLAVFMTAGIPAVGLASNAAVYSVYLSFMLPILLPYSAMLLLLGRDDPFQAVAGLASLVYALVLASIGHVASRTLTDALELRFRNLDLVGSVTRVNEELRTEIDRRERAEQVLIRATKKAEAASQAKSRFLAMMSHEIRTPMNGILGMIELLRASPLSANQRRHADCVDESARSLLQVINDVLDFSRVEAGQLALETKDFEVRATLAGAMELLATRARDKKLDLVWAVRDGVPALVRGDAGRLRQILVNLVGNAVKFTPAGRVEVRVTLAAPAPHDAHHLAFEVRDTGIGIPQEAQSRLFQAFSQVDDSAARHFGGTGLGLAICRQLVELMGGQIGVESKTGQGARFWFRIPFQAPLEPRPREKGMPQAALPPLEGLVLLVEDNPVNREIAVAALVGLGCAVHVAEAGGAAVVRAAQQRYDAILMDCEMPGLDGYAATRAIRADEAGAMPSQRRVPIIALTASATAADRARALEAGMDEHLPKPFTREQLGRVLAPFLEPTLERPLAGVSQT